MNNRRKRREKGNKRKRAEDGTMAERLLRLEQAKAELAEIKEEGPLIVDSSAFSADVDEIEPESEFNCFGCQVRRLAQTHATTVTMAITHTEIETMPRAVCAFS